MRRFLILGLIGLALIIVIPAVGYYVSFVGPPRKTIVRVNDTRFNLGDLMKILRSYQWSVQGRGQGIDLSRVPFDLVNIMMENELIKQNVPKLGLLVSEAEVTAEIHKTIMGEKKDESTPPAQLEREFKERYRQLLSGTRLSENEHRALVRAGLLRDKVRDRVSEEIPTVAPQYHLYSLAFENEKLAKEARTEFGRGLAFKDLVAKYSVDTQVVRTEGERGWFTEGVYPDLDQIVAKLEPGQLSEVRNEVISGAPGQSSKIQYALYLVKEKEKARNLDEEQRKLFKEQALQKWITEQRVKSVVETTFGSEEYTWVVQQLRKTEPPAPPTPSHPRPAG